MFKKFESIEILVFRDLMISKSFILHDKKAKKLLTNWHKTIILR